MYAVYMCERGGWGRGGCELRSTISDVIHTSSRYVSLAELGHVCQFGLGEPMLSFLFVYLHLKKKDEDRGYKNVTLETIMNTKSDKTVK
jgi:hypothetical protein